MTGRNLQPGGEGPDYRASEHDEEMALDPGIQDALGQALRVYSEDIVKQPIPDKFMALLAQLEAKERESK